MFFPEDAVAAMEAVFNVLAHRDLDGKEHRLAAQLPPGVSELLCRDGSPGERFTAGQFLRRVRVRLGSDEGQTNLAARAVLSSAAACAGGQQDVFIKHLPSDFAFLCQLDMP